TGTLSPQGGRGILEPTSGSLDSSVSFGTRLFDAGLTLPSLNIAPDGPGGEPQKKAENPSPAPKPKGVWAKLKAVVQVVPDKKDNKNFWAFLASEIFQYMSMDFNSVSLPGLMP